MCYFVKFLIINQSQKHLRNYMSCYLTNKLNALNVFENSESH